MEFTVYLSLVFLALYLFGLALHRLLFLRDKRRMQAESRLGGRVVATVNEIETGSVKKFWIICQEYRVDGFLLNDNGHMTTPLDFIRDQFLSEDRRHLMCYTHGALYEFATGLCIAGPCKGESLYRLPVRIDHGEVLVGCPEGDLSYLKD